MEASLMEQIKTSLATNARTATFACGGSIPITPTSTNTTTETSSPSPPVQVRYGSNGLGSVFNIPGSDPSSKEFKELLNVSLPATFGRAGEEVLDEDYRKAGKLDRGQFTTDFCPYAAGIVDTLTQMLLPQTKQSKHNRSIKVWFSIGPLLTFHQLTITGRAVQAQCLQCSQWQVQATCRHSAQRNTARKPRGLASM
jgi:hypothetical protein